MTARDKSVNYRRPNLFPVKAEKYTLRRPAPVGKTTSQQGLVSPPPLPVSLREPCPEQAEPSYFEVLDKILDNSYKQFQEKTAWVIQVGCFLSGGINTALMDL